MSADLQPARLDVPAADQFSTWLELRTRNRDTDQFGHVNHAAMATLFEESRVALVFSSELADETRGVHLLVASLTMAFHKELRAPGTVRIGAVVTRIGTSSLDIQQAIFSEGICFASALAVCVLFGAESRRPVRASDAFRAALLATG